MPPICEKGLLSIGIRASDQIFRCNNRKQAVTLGFLLAQLLTKVVPISGVKISRASRVPLQLTYPMFNALVMCKVCTCQAFIYFLYGSSAVGACLQRDRMSCGEARKQSIFWQSQLLSLHY